MEKAETTALEQTTIDDFPLRTYEKLRYVDTDRQGHVNNAVFAACWKPIVWNCSTTRIGH
jgi:acyl-ACP thioesterase